MKHICLLVLAVLLLLSNPVSVQAEDPAKYNFTSTQGNKDLKIQPGHEGSGYIYFYNIDGNRITHITIAVSQVPTEWEVIIEPRLSETQVLVSGMTVTVLENLYVEPSKLLAEEPQNVPAGMFSIKVSGRGYALGKRAQVLVRMPYTVPVGTTGKITITAEATWLGQSGAAAVKQVRDFDFSVTAVSEPGEYNEKIIGKGEITRWLPAIITGALVLPGVTLTLLLVRRKRMKYNMHAKIPGKS